MDIIMLHKNATDLLSLLAASFFKDHHASKHTGKNWLTAFCSYFNVLIQHLQNNTFMGIYNIQHLKPIQLKKPYGHLTLKFYKNTNIYV